MLPQRQREHSLPQMISVQLNWTTILLDCKRPRVVHSGLGRFVPRLGIAAEGMRSNCGPAGVFNGT